MTKRGLAIIGAYFSVLLLLSCQRDDICPEATETTPLLQIEFFDAENPQTLKVVEDLIVIAEGEPDPVIGPVTTNNIAIPLRTDQSFTEYSFIINSDSEDENEDTVRFTYNPTLDYLNRACGFKMEFLNLTVTTDIGNDSWIRSYIIETEDIENEAATHISITH